MFTRIREEVVAQVVTADSQELHLHAFVEQARANGWTISYESDCGQWVGCARRGKVMLTSSGESIVEAIWRVLEKTRRFPIGDT